MFRSESIGVNAVNATYQGHRSELDQGVKSPVEMEISRSGGRSLLDRQSYMYLKQLKDVTSAARPSLFAQNALITFRKATCEYPLTE